MQLRQIEETLRGNLRAAAIKEEPPRKRDLWRRFQRNTPDAAKSGNARSSRGDLVIAGFGIALGLGCALFPWYIFYNQDQFGIRAMKFGGNSGEQSDPVVLGSQGDRIGAPIEADDIPSMELDLFATGTLASEKAEGEQGAPGLVEQPFPGAAADFRVIHVANGRAMIEDDAGLWLVQRGSLLPDDSRVTAIEQRAGAWVLVTSANRVIGVSP
ncbi:MAG: hypothetical protein H0T56_14250 [Pseudaminobacter sp.]|nr:hypothetical protein [Pseudaminobacter sp.]